ncbi:MAG: dUTP diphosphatase [Cytophagales bacterium]|nr:dUTP diphosphatase [Cytophagales bacterium]
MKIQIINRSCHPLPAYQTQGSAGMDIRAFLKEDLKLKPMHRELCPTGLYIALSSGIEVQIRPRSGLALKKGITLLNSPGTIDSDYRGEIKILVINLSNKTVFIKDGDRIAQLVFVSYIKGEWEEVQELPGTVRQEGGFGSTGQD